MGLYNDHAKIDWRSITGCVATIRWLYFARNLIVITTRAQNEKVQAKPGCDISDLPFRDVIPSRAYIVFVS